MVIREEKPTELLISIVLQLREPSRIQNPGGLDQNSELRRDAFDSQKLRAFPELIELETTHHITPPACPTTISQG
jgi:hypothetical protein